jgi:DNA-binding NtrC family response regulator
MHAADDLPVANGRDRPPTVLVVDDEILVRLAVAEYLRESGYRVLEAASVDEAVAVLSVGEAVDVLFSDIRMPGERDGIALAQWTHANRPDVRVLLTSGFVGLARQVNELCDDAPFLPKPYSYDALYQHISRLSGRAGAVSGS